MTTAGFPLKISAGMTEYGFFARNAFSNAAFYKNLSLNTQSALLLG
jgi:hypothetical protein